MESFSILLVCHQLPASPKSNGLKPTHKLYACSFNVHASKAWGDNQPLTHDHFKDHSI